MWYIYIRAHEPRRIAAVLVPSIVSRHTRSQGHDFGAGTRAALASQRIPDLHILVAHASRASSREYSKSSTSARVNVSASTNSMSSPAPVEGAEAMSARKRVLQTALRAELFGVCE